MARVVDEAMTALRRWQQMNESEPPPPVRVFLGNGEEHTFTGLAVAPGASPEIVSISGSGLALPIVVIRDADISRIEIGQSRPPPFAFNR